MRQGLKPLGRRDAARRLHKLNGIRRRKEAGQMLRPLIMRLHFRVVSVCVSLPVCVCGRCVCVRVSKHKDGNANQLATARETTNRAGMNKKRTQEANVKGAK